MATRHFLSLMDLSREELDAVIERAIELKALRNQGIATEPFRDKVLGMIFEKSSTRTRVSFEAGMAQMGGSALFLSPRDTQLGRGEPIEDSARVISRMVDMVMIRTFGHNVLERFAAYSRVPVINALSDSFHPCQLLADIQTYVEHRGSPAGKVVAWVGDGNNMCNSYINAARQCDFELRIACPEGYEPDENVLAAAGDRVTIVRKPVDAVRGADWVATDVWASMGQETEQAVRMKAFEGFLVDHELMSHANERAVFMHCLPAHRGEEVSGELLEDENISVVWDEAENRLHAQKALMEFLQENSR
ncbi:ornithine carbamoyltransferase [Microbulbifer flavimaris]|uniref:Ornithine carbamoyltransferase n=1 Tax=Microbulbifer flavimaris TaxID=1781068 RepID=A0ABX4I302_9GAMM|nr:MULTISPECIES: ornithine carbamoyltransferase [Microbulbifer]KUJ84212.1 ornithine carbamoyltransferase [Microbulbifer sp. ZGT114]PCO06287.1 ornithine carbamoyltransferase [Microbulbifer flavimaris]